MKEYKIKDRVAAEFSSAITAAPESRAFAAMVKILAADGYIKKERMLEVCLAYNGFMENLYGELAYATILGEVLTQSQGKVIRMYERELDEINKIMDGQVSAKDIIPPKVAPEKWKAYVSLLQNHELELNEFFRTTIIEPAQSGQN